MMPGEMLLAAVSVMNASGYFADKINCLFTVYAFIL